VIPLAEIERARGVLEGLVVRTPLVRLDADTDAEINGMVTFVPRMTANGGQSWIIATSPATIAAPKTYVLFSANTAEVSWSLAEW